jgi:hypothetical protein
MMTARRKRSVGKRERRDMIERSSAASWNEWNASPTVGAALDPMAGRGEAGGLSASSKRVNTRAMLRYFYQESVNDLPMSWSEFKQLIKSLEETKLRLIQLLLEAGANPNSASRAGGLTPFHVAATEAIALRLLETQHLDRSLRSEYVTLNLRIKLDTHNWFDLIPQARRVVSARGEQTRFRECGARSARTGRARCAVAHLRRDRRFRLRSCRDR